MLFVNNQSPFFRIRCSFSNCMPFIAEWKTLVPRFLIPDITPPVPPTRSRLHPPTYCCQVLEVAENLVTRIHRGTSLIRKRLLLGYQMTLCHKAATRPVSAASCTSCRRWSSNPSGKCSSTRPTRGTVCGTLRSMCGADAGCLAIDYQSLCAGEGEKQAFSSTFSCVT